MGDQVSWKPGSVLSFRSCWDEFLRTWRRVSREEDELVDPERFVVVEFGGEIEVVFGFGGVGAEEVAHGNHTGGIEELLITGDAVPVEYYDMMGRQTSGLHPGINLIKMSDGAVKKVLVK